MEIINLPESASGADFAQYIQSGERHTSAFTGLVQTDQNGDLCILDSIPPEGYTIAPVGTTVVRFVRVNDVPENARRSTHSTFVGWEKEVVGKIIDVRYFGHGNAVRYDIDASA